MTLRHQGTRRDGRMPYEISWWQVSMLIVSFHLPLLATYSPMTSAVLPPVRDAWIAALVAWVPGLLLALGAWWLAKRFEGENLYEFTRTIFGRYLGTIVNVGLTWGLINWAIIVTREFAVFMASAVYLRTPELVFVIMFLMLAVIGASQQIEFVARTAELSGPLVMVGIFLLTIATIPQTDFGMLRPVLAEGWQAVARQALTPVGVYGEAVVVALIAIPYLNKLSDGPKAIGVGIGLNVVFATAGTAVLMAIFGPELLAVLAFPPMTAARLIQIGDTFERLEWILFLLWYGAMGVKISLLLLGARLGVSSIFPRQRPGISLLIVISLVFIRSLFMLPTLTDLLSLLRPERFLLHTLPLQLAPMVFIVVALLRGVRSSNR